MYRVVPWCHRVLSSRVIRAAGNKREELAGFGAKSEHSARSMSSTAIEHLRNRSTGGLQRSVVVNSDGKSRSFGRLGSATRSRMMRSFGWKAAFGQTMFWPQGCYDPLSCLTGLSNGNKLLAGNVS